MVRPKALGPKHRCSFCQVCGWWGLCHLGGSQARPVLGALGPFSEVVSDARSLTEARSLTLPHCCQVRYTQLVRKKQKAQHRCMRRVGRTGSRRSGYAFSHQEGFGELIMSGKNMRLSSLALSTFTTRSSSSWIESLRRKKSDSASSPSGGADKPLKG